MYDVFIIYFILVIYRMLNKDQMTHRFMELKLPWVK